MTRRPAPASKARKAVPAEAAPAPRPPLLNRALIALSLGAIALMLLIEEQLSLREIFSSAGWPRVRRRILASLPVFLIAPALYVFVERMNPPTVNYGGVGRLQYLQTRRAR